MEIVDMFMNPPERTDNIAHLLIGLYTLLSVNKDNPKWVWALYQQPGLVACILIPKADAERPQSKNCFILGVYNEESYVSRIRELGYKFPPV